MYELWVGVQRVAFCFYCIGGSVLIYLHRRWCYAELVFTLLSLVFLRLGGVLRAVELSLPRRRGCLNMGGQRGGLLWRQRRRKSCLLLGRY
jgi:hypothetical protein